MDGFDRASHEIRREVVGTDTPKEDSSVTLDTERYYSEDFADKEWDFLFTKTWLVACRIDHVANPGNFHVFEIGSESILVSRGSDNEIRAFYNVCRHRGNRLVRGKRCGTAKSFGCSFHMWEWHNTGKLKNIPDQEVFPGLPCDDKLALKSLKCDTWGGFVFVSMSDDVPPLLEFLHPIPEKVDKYGIDRMALVMDQTIEWDCNWKVGVDAFNETYHVAATHPQLLPVIDDYNVRIECDERHNFFTVPYGVPSPRVPSRDSIPAALAAFMDQRKAVLSGTGKTEGSDAVLEASAVDPETFTGGANDVRRAVQAKKRQSQNDFPFLPYKELTDSELTDDFHVCLFPQIQFNLFAETLLVFRHRPYPGNVDKSYFDVWYLSHVSDENERPPLPEATFSKASEGKLEHTLQQDASNVATVQAGMRSRSSTELYLGELEARVRHFHKVLDSTLASNIEKSDGK